MTKRILVSDKVHPLLIDGLLNAGFEVDYHPKMPYDEVKAVVNDYHGIIINSKVICDQDFIDQAHHLDFIGRLGSGLDIIDLPYAKKRGIEVISSPEGNANAVAEHALGMLLNLQHNLAKSHQDVRQLNWNREPNRGNELVGKTVGIIGYGHTGPAFAQKLSGCYCEILVYDKYRTDYTEDKNDVRVVDLETLLAESDVVSIHLPLTAQTRGLVDANFLHKMKQNSMIINTSRGHILSSSDLLAAMQAGHIRGACLDVLENEKPDTWTPEETEMYQALLDRNDVMITPHIAGWTHRSLRLIAEILLTKISAFYVV